MKAYPISQTEIIEVFLNRHRNPISFKNKVDELMEEGAFDTREEAEKWVENTPIALELMYEKGYGLFAVESDAIGADVYSPYSQEEIVVECD